jgi:hypothetical protein
VIRGILLQVLLLTQGIAVLPSQNGTIAGTLKTESAHPAAGVRVGVMVQPENLADVVGAASLVSIAETDDSGKFRLDNIPPGRYYITAGRVEQPTYFPGALDIAAGRIVTVGANESVSGIDFTLKDISDRGVETVNAALRIPIHLYMDNDARIPVFSDRGKIRLRLTHASDGNRVEVPLNFDTLTLPIAAGEYHVELVNLPEGYSLTSLKFGSIDLTRDGLRVTLDDLPQPLAGDKMFLTDTVTGIVMQRRVQSSSSNSQSSPNFVVLGSITSKTMLTLSLVAVPMPAPKADGVQVRGRVEGEGQQEVYLSGTPGTLYADGSFEFRNVAAGSYIVAMVGSTSTSRQFGAVIAVGGSDMDNVELQDTISLPLDVMSSNRSSKTSTVSTPGSMHSIHGHVVEESTKTPVAGIVTFQGYARSMTYSLPADGEFEIPNLLPGRYNLTIDTFDRSSLTRSIVLEDEDLDLSLAVSKRD